MEEKRISNAKVSDFIDKLTTEEDMVYIMAETMWFLMLMMKIEL